MNANVVINWVDVGPAAEVAPQSARRVESVLGPIAVFRTVTDEYYAVFDKCPHKGGPLSEGIVHGNAVTCPLHNWVISLETGKALGADEGEVRVIPVRNEGGRLSIALETLMMAAE